MHVLDTSSEHDYTYLHKTCFLSVWQVAVDPKPFLGINSVADAVDYLHSGKSVGKVFIPYHKAVAFIFLIPLILLS